MIMRWVLGGRGVLGWLRSKFVINKALSITSAFPRRDLEGLGEHGTLVRSHVRVGNDCYCYIESNDYLITGFFQFSLPYVKGRNFFSIFLVAASNFLRL